MPHTSVFIVLFCTMFFYNFTVSQSKFGSLERMLNLVKSKLIMLEGKVDQKVRTFQDGLGKEKQHIRNKLNLFEVMKRQQAKAISEFEEKSDKRLTDIEKEVSVRKEFIDRKVIDMNNKTAWITKSMNDNMDIVNTSQNALKHEVEELKEKLENVDETIKKLEMKTAHLPCPDGWVAYKRNCYLVGSEQLTFKKAHDFCTEQEAHLVRIEDSLENDFLKHMLKKLKVHYAWIGLTDQRDEGIWRWYGTDDRATFFDWGPGEPNNDKNNEDCVAIRTWNALDWNDFDCNKMVISRPLCEK
ncbi:CD209 antigen-like protein 2 [Mercenaria mercenaria]|uniref:CD209 antigen-like protein 2 n=1 Tax=Mercenaria mercenaria TaxID=6596 RepID=UPI00234F7C48|nr:CD209 antigen-like protein 2 [Mercenaria mercenaria]